MHIYFSGIGGTGIGPLALIAKQAGYDVSGSDKQHSQYIDYLKKQGVNRISIGQDYQTIAFAHTHDPIDWVVYSSALPKENPNHPELLFAEQNQIRRSKRDEFLNHLLKDTSQKLIAIGGTHGKTTTTAMTVWLAQQLELPMSYLVPAKISFGEMGHFDETAEYFIYEADEYDRNFLSYTPAMSIISGIDWDHPDVYPTREEYYEAFREFLDASDKSVLWQADAKRIAINETNARTVLAEDTDLTHLKLVGEVNRRNAHAAIVALEKLGFGTYNDIAPCMQDFPGVSRRFEKIADNIYSDYAHTPEKIRGALQLAHEVAGDNLIVIYEGLHNTRQHFIKEELKHLFDDVKELYIVPSYLAREDPDLEMLTPENLISLTSKPDIATASKLDDELKKTISKQAEAGNLVLCLTAGGGGSLDEWLRNSYST
ncbi:MAG: Mur ligase domain-containing protein [bacterium]|nr:Mur ligase domain-containing protein [bacterium]